MDSSPAILSSSTPNPPPPSSSSDSDEDVNPQGFDHRLNHGFTEIFNRNVSASASASASGLELSVSSFTVVLIFWFLVSMALVMHVYGPKDVWIGPNSSILVQPNSIFVQSLKVKELDDAESGLELFGFYSSPSLDVLLNWSESRLLSIPHQSYKGWPYYLNEGSSINISYSVKPEGSSVQLVVIEGMQGLVSRWLDKDAYRNNAFSWNQIKGSGTIELNIRKSSTYNVAVTNSNTKDVMVELDVDVRAVLYDTRQSFYKCTFGNGECTFNTMFLVGDSVVLTSPAPRPGASVEEEWYIRLSYQPRWIAYIIGTGLLICFMLVLLQFCKRLQCNGGEGYFTGNDSENSQRARLLANKDDGSSSNESFAADDADLEEFTGNEGETSGRRLCAICFDSLRDCFFLPCGHCVSCYQCGIKVAETGGSCPVCRRKIKKVKRIYTV